MSAGGERADGECSRAGMEVGRRGYGAGGGVEEKTGSGVNGEGRGAVVHADGEVWGEQWDEKSSRCIKPIQ